MIIEWYGHSCFMVTSSDGTKILMDPYKNALGYKLPQKLTADIVTTSHDHSDHNCIKAVKSSFLHINKTGSFSEHGIEVKGIETFHDKVSGAKKGNNIVYNFKIDGLKVCHCGDLGHTLGSSLIKEIGNTDILLLPVGGGFTLGSVDAVEVIKELNPTVIIPMHYRTKALGPMGLVFEKVDKFISASGRQAKEYPNLVINSENIKDYAGIAVLKYK